MVNSIYSYSSNPINIIHSFIKTLCSDSSLDSRFVSVYYYDHNTNNNIIIIIKSIKETSYIYIHSNQSS